MSGMDIAQAAAELTESTKYIGQPTANKARGWMDGSPICEHQPIGVSRHVGSDSQAEGRVHIQDVSCFKASH